MLRRSAWVLSGSVGFSRSTQVIRSSRVKVVTTFFFQPRQLGGESADLGLQRADLLLMRRLDGGHHLALVAKEVRQAFERDGFPLVELGGVHPMLRCDLCNRLLFLQEL